MIQEPLQQEILSRIDRLAEKLGVTVEYLWPQLVRLTVIEAVTCISATIVTTVIAAVLCVNAVKTGGDDPGWVIGAALAGLVALILLITAVGYAIPALLAPEAVTLRGLLP